MKTISENCSENYFYYCFPRRDETKPGIGSEPRNTTRLIWSCEHDGISISIMEPRNQNAR